ncbi:MAG TPA: bifunctional UDP-sugar hydrolase/5'-nucleotidase, partial [Kofleriaceae bacterium]|nr:bifunctional UDP-sugar hydrolase/5'-nucleotidase [Kofleriaceae bacterium]
TIIHPADIHSRLFPYTFVPNTFDQGYGLLPINAPFGGIARIASMVKTIRKTSNRSLWLDSGDCFQGAPVFNEFKGEAEMRALTVAGLDGAVLGNHEFDLGSKNLFDKIDNWAGYPILAGNYAWDDPPPAAAISNGRSLRDVIAPYEIFDVQGIKVGVIGMGNTDTLSSIYEGGNNLGFRPIDNASALQQWVRFIRPQVDLVVVVSHLGLDQDEDLTPSQVDDENLALPLKGVDLILGGHLHIVTNPPKIIPNDDLGHSTVLVHSGAFAKYVGRLDLVVHVGTDNNDLANRSRITSFSYINQPVDVHVPDDPDIASLMWPYSVKLNQDIDLNGVFAYVDPQPSTAKILRSDASGGDSQLGNLVARSMQVQDGVQAEFALTNSLGIRADFERGALTIEQMFNVFPFENTITVMYLSGVEVQEMLDFVSQRSSERGCKTQAQVAGITFDMVCHGTCPDGGTACAKNIYLGDNCRAGRADGPIDPTKCAPLLPASLYRVAVNDYIAAGGSGFDVLKRNSSKQDTGVSLRDSLRVYLNGQTRCGADVVNEQDTVMPPRTVLSLFGNISCLDEKVEAHDGRIRPVFE